MRTRTLVRILPIITPLLACALPSSAHAGNDLLTAQYTACVDSHTSNMEWNACGHEEIERQEKRLNDTWKKLSSALKKWASSNHPYPDCPVCGSDEPLSSLLAEQRNWIKWKDSACEFWLRSGRGREADVLSYPMCKATVIAHRTAYLKGLLDQFEDR